MHVKIITITKLTTKGENFYSEENEGNPINPEWTMVRFPVTFCKLLRALEERMEIKTLE